MPHACQARVFWADEDAETASIGAALALTDAATIDINENVLPGIRKKNGVKHDELLLIPEGGPDGVPKCGSPAVEFIEHGKYRWRVWLCAFHFDSYQTYAPSDTE